MTTRPLVSIVIPVLRDTQELRRLLETLLNLDRDQRDGVDFLNSYEVIVVNGDPDDESIQRVRQMFPDVKWMDSLPGRGHQMNLGARLASGRWLLFLHADTSPDPGWLREIQRVDRGASMSGAFAFRLESTARMARVVERGVDLRVRLCGLPYGDQGIFVRRQLFEELGGYAPLPIMEDIDLVRRLCRRGPMERSSVAVRVSARRWERDGWLRRSALNISLAFLFVTGVSPQRLARRYYGWEPSPVPVTVGGPLAQTASLPDGSQQKKIVVIIPALDEEAAIGQVLEEIPEVVTSVTVVDNGSTDRTAETALASGAEVVTEPRKGYGRACLAGLQSNPDADIVVFLDADRSDYPEEMTAILAPILADEADFVLGYRSGIARPFSARLGTSLCVVLINLLWHTHYQDLGPFRAIGKAALDRLRMVDQTWGWTIEMQVKAAEAGLRTIEFPVRQRPRIGSSKISGTARGSIRAGSRMLATIWSLWRTRHRRQAEMRVIVDG